MVSEVQFVNDFHYHNIYTVYYITISWPKIDIIFIVIKNS